MRRRLFPLLALAAALAALTLTACGVAPTPTPAGDVRITLRTEPARPRAGEPTTMQLSVEQGGAPLSGARVLVVRRMVGVSYPGDDIVFESLDQGGGRYLAATSFAADGRWDVQVVVTPPAGGAATATFAVEVGPR